MPLSVSRRAFLGGAAALGATASHALEEAPRQGGMLRLGLGGGSTSDGFDPSTWNDSVMIDAGFGIFDALIENGPDNQPLPELAEHFGPDGGAENWVLDLRKGVEFHNGKTFGADDAIFSLNRHRGKTTSGAAGQMRAVKDIVKLDPNRIRIELHAADADFPSVLTDYHIMMVPEGFNDWERPIGTGAFSLDWFDPGVRIDLKKARNYWRTDRGHLDAVEILVINDTSARLGALVSGQVDAVNRVDPKIIPLLQRRRGIEIVRSPGGWFAIISLMVDHRPFDHPDLRKALKFAIDRPQMLKTLFSGYGSVGNDHPVPRTDPYFDAQLPQTPHDPDHARFLFRRLGLSDPRIVCEASDAAFNGAVDMAVLFQTDSRACGIPVGVRKVPPDGFFDGVWLKAACVASSWAGRPAATQILATMFKSDAPWNETHWRDSGFDKRLADARAELNVAKRREYIYAMQAQLNAEGGAVIPVFRDWLDAHSVKVGGHTPHAGLDMDNGRIAEKAWLRA